MNRFSARIHAHHVKARLIAGIAHGVRDAIGVLLVLRRTWVRLWLGLLLLGKPKQGVNLWLDPVGDDRRLLALPECLQLLIGVLLAVVIVAVPLGKRRASVVASNASSNWRNSFS